MRVEQLNYLLETAKTASINKSSERLHITQQSLNSSLTKLEQELGVKLLERSSKGVSLTKNGEIVAEYAQEILQKVKEMERAIQPNQDGQTSQLRDTLELSAGSSFSHGVLPMVISKLHAMHKQVRVSLVERENLDMIQGLLNNDPRFYLMVIFNEGEREFAMLDLRKMFYRTIGECKIYALLREKHPLAQQKVVTTRALLKYPMALYQASEKTPNPMLEYMQVFGKVQIVVQTNNIEVYRRYIVDDDVVGFIPQFNNKYLQRHSDGMVLVPIKDFPVMKIVCLSDIKYYQKKQKLIDIFLQNLQEVLGESYDE